MGDVVRDTILDPGTEDEKNFLDDPKTGLKDLEMLVTAHLELPFGLGEAQLLLNSNFLFLFEDLRSAWRKDSDEDNLESCIWDLGSNSSTNSLKHWFILPLLFTAY